MGGGCGGGGSRCCLPLPALAQLGDKRFNRSPIDTHAGIGLAEVSVQVFLHLFLGGGRCAAGNGRALDGNADTAQAGLGSGDQSAKENAEVPIGGVVAYKKKGRAG